jgi:hypothetical protein
MSLSCFCVSRANCFGVPDPKATSTSFTVRTRTCVWGYDATPPRMELMPEQQGKYFGAGSKRQLCKKKRPCTVVNNRSEHRMKNPRERPAGRTKPPQNTRQHANNTPHSDFNQRLNSHTRTHHTHSFINTHYDVKTTHTPNRNQVNACMSQV